MFPFGLLELCLFFEIATSATFDPLILPLAVPSIVNSSNANNTLGDPHQSPRYHCEPKSYPEADARSCQNAASKIGGSRARLTFVQRESGGPGIPLPFNWVSGM